MVRWPSLRPDESTATAVWLRLCASIPTITMVVSPFFSWGDNDRPGGHLSVGAMPRSYQATPCRSTTSPAAQLDEATRAGCGGASRQRLPIVTLRNVVYELSCRS